MLKEIEKCWLWAAMHHKDFSKCKVTLEQPVIAIRSCFLSPYSGTLATICIDLRLPTLALDIPWHIVESYKEAMDKIGAKVNVDCIIDDIPF